MLTLIANILIVYLEENQAGKRYIDVYKRRPYIIVRKKQSISLILYNFIFIKAYFKLLSTLYKRKSNCVIRNILL